MSSMKAPESSREPARIAQLREQNDQSNLAIGLLLGTIHPFEFVSYRYSYVRFTCRLRVLPAIIGGILYNTLPIAANKCEVRWRIRPGTNS
jgi:hypothetical protein